MDKDIENINTSNTDSENSDNYEQNAEQGNSIDKVKSKQSSNDNDADSIVNAGTSMKKPLDDKDMYSEEDGTRHLERVQDTQDKD